MMSRNVISHLLVAANEVIMSSKILLWIGVIPINYKIEHAYAV